MALGETIALLEGLDMVALASTMQTKAEIGIDSMPQDQPEALLNPDESFARYMNDSGVSAGTNSVPFITADLRTGGSNWEPGLPLIPTSMGLGADLAESVGMLEGQAHVGRRVHRQVPQGQVRDAVITGGTEGFYGGNVVNPASMFPGASLTYSRAGLSAAPTPRASQRTADALPDAWLRQHFADDAAYQMFVRFAGEVQVKKVFKQRASFRNTPTHYWNNEKGLLVILTARRRLFQSQHAPWTSVDVARILGSAQVDVSARASNGNGVAGFEGLNNGLAGLEGRIGRKIKKSMKKVGRVAAGVATGGASEVAYRLSGAELSGLEGKVGRKLAKGFKKVGKVVGKATLAVGKAGASYFTAGASNAVFDAATPKKKAVAPVPQPQPTTRATLPRLHARRQARAAQQPQVQSSQIALQRRQPTYSQQSYESQGSYAPTSGGDYEAQPVYQAPQPTYSAPEYDEGAWE